MQASSAPWAAAGTGSLRGAAPELMRKTGRALLSKPNQGFGDSPPNTANGGKGSGLRHLLATGERGTPTTPPTSAREILGESPPGSLVVEDAGERVEHQGRGWTLRFVADGLVPTGAM